MVAPLQPPSPASNSAPPPPLLPAHFAHKGVGGGGERRKLSAQSHLKSCIRPPCCCSCRLMLEAIDGQEIWRNYPAEEMAGNVGQFTGTRQAVINEAHIHSR